MSMAKTRFMSPRIIAAALAFGCLFELGSKVFSAANSPFRIAAGMTDAFKDIEKLESDLWEAADNLRANSKLTSSDYFMPVLGVIFLRHAANRFDAATRQITEDQAGGKMPRRKVLAADYIRRRALAAL